MIEHAGQITCNAVAMRLLLNLVLRVFPLVSSFLRVLFFIGRGHCLYLRVVFCEYSLRALLVCDFIRFCIPHSTVGLVRSRLMA